jgi:hypothetical protein
MVSMVASGRNEGFSEKRKGSTLFSQLQFICAWLSVFRIISSEIRGLLSDNNG